MPLSVAEGRARTPSLNLHLYLDANNMIIVAFLSYPTMTDFHPILIKPINVKGTFMQDATKM